MALIHQVQHALVRGGADHTPCGLNYFLQTWIQVHGVIAVSIGAY